MHGPWKKLRSEAARRGTCQGCGSGAQWIRSRISEDESAEFEFEQACNDCKRHTAASETTEG